MAKVARTAKKLKRPDWQKQPEGAKWPELPKKTQFLNYPERPKRPE